MNIKDPQAHEIIQGIVFSQRIKVFLLANSSMDNTKSKVEKGRDGFLWPLGLRIDKLYFHLLTSGTGAHLVYQAISAYGSTPYLNVGIMKDGQSCHHLSPTPQLVGTIQTKVASSLDTTSTLSTMTLALARNIRLYQESSTRASTMGWMTNPQTSKSIA